MKHFIFESSKNKRIQWSQERKWKRKSSGCLRKQQQQEQQQQQQWQQQNQWNM